MLKKQPHSSEVEPQTYVAFILLPTGGVWDLCSSLSLGGTGGWGASQVPKARRGTWQVTRWLSGLHLAVTRIFQSHFSGHSESRDHVLLQKGLGHAAPSWAQKEERPGVFDKGKACFYWINSCATILEESMLS